MPLLIWLGLAISLSGAVAQEERIPGAQSSEVNLNKPAHFQIWRKIALGTYKGVDAYRRALESAGIKTGDAADEILGRPAFRYGTMKSDVELVLVSAADLGVETEDLLLPTCTNAQGKLVLSCALPRSDRNCGWTITISRAAKLSPSRWSR